MALIDDQAKNVALKIQEALRGTVAVAYEHALPVAFNVVEKYGINSVASVAGLREFAAEELRLLADAVSSPIPTQAEVEAAGYTKEAAATIVAQEKEKAALNKAQAVEAAAKEAEADTVKAGADDQTLSNDKAPFPQVPHEIKPQTGDSTTDPDSGTSGSAKAILPQVKSNGKNNPDARDGGN